jgi:hypothetical protein
MQPPPPKPPPHPTNQPPQPTHHQATLALEGSHTSGASSRLQQLPITTLRAESGGKASKASAAMAVDNDDDSAPGEGVAAGLLAPRCVLCGFVYVVCCVGSVWAGRDSAECCPSHRWNRQRQHHFTHNVSPSPPHTHTHPSGWRRSCARRTSSCGPGAPRPTAPPRPSRCVLHASIPSRNQRRRKKTGIPTVYVTIGEQTSALASRVAQPPPEPLRPPHPTQTQNTNPPFPPTHKHHLHQPQPGGPLHAQVPGPGAARGAGGAAPHGHGRPPPMPPGQEPGTSVSVYIDACMRGRTNEPRSSSRRAGDRSIE